jgi:RNA polymerase Rpb4
MSDNFQEENVSTLSFGKEFQGAVFLSNTAAAVILDAVQQTKYSSKGLRPPEVYAKALAYAKANTGAIKSNDPHLIDDLFFALRALSFERSVNVDDSSKKLIKLHEYEVTSLVNLSPSSISAARSLIPSLERFTDDEVNEILTTLRRSTAKTMLE